MSKQTNFVFILISMIALTSFVRADSNKVPERTEEEKRQINEKLDTMVHLLCNLETKKYLVANNADIKTMTGEKWAAFYKKLVGVLMAGCIEDLSVPGHLEKVVSAKTQEERTQIIFPMADRIKVADIKSLDSFELTEKEQLLHDLFNRVSEQHAKGQYASSGSSY